MNTDNNGFEDSGSSPPGITPHWVDAARHPCLDAYTYRF
jgi:hypothetical protein